MNVESGSQENGSYPERDAEFWKQRSWKLSAVFLAAVVVMALLALLAGEGSGKEVAGRDGVRANANANPRQAPLQASGRPKGCQTDDKRQAIPASSPKEVAWKRLGITDVPTSSSAGPLRIDGPVWWCFARTPLGAVLAAHIIPSHMSGDEWLTVTEQQVVPGLSRDLFVAQRSTVPNANSTTRASSSYAGFRVSSFSLDSAKVELLIKQAQGGFGSTIILLKWSEGDWKVEPRLNGTIYSTITSAESAGFTMWKV
ncbi:hypothetical protein [Streptomyces chartreusis]|uniref:hypothetical protein n=1 Tax=Streptomyces chartreusis TaxID=1969 RepID=UPI0036C5B051